MKVPTVAITDTNSDPALVTYPIPANDDAVKSINMIVGLVSDAIAAGRALYDKKQAEKPAPVAELKKPRKKAETAEEAA